MRKVIVTFVVSVAMILTCNAQLFVGGGLGLDLTGGKTKLGGNSYDHPSEAFFSFTPKVGFYLIDDLAIGTKIGLGIYSEKYTPPGSGSQEQKTNGFGWEFSPFARYRVLGDEKVSLHLEAALGIGGYKEKYKSGGNSTDGDPLFTFGLGVLPVVTYSITEKLDLEASFDFLRFGFSIETETDESNSDNKSTDTHFGFGVNSSYNPLAAQGMSIDGLFTGLLKVGLVYRF